MRDQRVGGQSVSQQTLTEPWLFARRWRVRSSLSSLRFFLAQGIPQQGALSPRSPGPPSGQGAQGPRSWQRCSARAEMWFPLGGE